MSSRRHPRWRVDLQADPPSVQTWSVRAGLQLLSSSHCIELRHLSRHLPRERGVWIRRSITSQGPVPTLTSAIDPTRGRLEADRQTRRGCGTGRLALDGHSGFSLRCGLVTTLVRSIFAATTAAIRCRRSTMCEPSSPASGRRGLRDRRLRASHQRHSRVLYQVVAWDPRGSGDPEGRDQLNQSRAALIDVVRTAFGPRFVGGFVPTPHARETFPHLVTNQPVGRRDYPALSQRVEWSSLGLACTTGSVEARRVPRSVTGDSL